MDVLLLGSGRDRKCKIAINGRKDFFNDAVVALDIDPMSKPDVVFDLNELPKGNSLPFENDSFDEIHAYDVLEHIGKQGDWRGYFKEFAEYHRVLRHDGRFFILVPVGQDAICDPGHSRFFSGNHFAFLCQGYYEQETSVTDYRWYWKNNFEIDYLSMASNHHIAAILRKT